jgi:LacI family gluconate utilization system Gnt-I transcriptional repressor
LGLSPVQVVAVPAPTTLKSGRQALRQLLHDLPAVDAVFCSSDLLALGVLTEARAQGRAVPDQLAVMGFGDLDFAADLEPALSTVQIDGAAMGRQAARFLIDRAEGRAVAQSVVDIGFSIIERDST